MLKRGGLCGDRQIYRSPQKGGDNCCEHGITWASSTRGGIGREAAKWFTTGFATKVALARSDGEKWRVRNERKRLLQQHSAIIARRNWEITQRNAWPRMGGVAPRAPPVE